MSSAASHPSGRPAARRRTLNGPQSKILIAAAVAIAIAANHPNVSRCIFGNAESLPIQYAKAESAKQRKEANQANTCLTERGHIASQYTGRHCAGHQSSVHWSPRLPYAVAHLQCEDQSDLVRSRARHRRDRNAMSK